MNTIDHYLNRITMYRLVLYVLILLVALGIFIYPPISIITSTILVLLTSWITNKIFSIVFDAPTNLESVYITSLILVLILPPIQIFSDIPILFWAGVISISSKYIFAIGKKHIFNPAAIAAVLIYFGLGSSANWWVGSAIQMPFVLLGGLLIVRKLQKETLFLTFLSTVISISAVLVILQGSSILTLFSQLLFHSSLLFFASIMLTEPQTMPPSKSQQIFYSALVGFLFIPQIHIGSFNTSPEIALVVGNIFSYLVSPKTKLWLKLEQKIQLTPDTLDFIFNKNQKLNFLPGQYLEFTLAHKKPDSRGTRRYFTIASSPTENNLRFGIKFSKEGSSFKKALLKLDQSTPLVASQLSGSLTLPKDQNKKLVFIAGGIGITPYRSMIKFLLDQNQPRKIKILYSTKTKNNILYKDVFDAAEKKLNIHTVYTLTDTSQIPQGWKGKIGRIDQKMITQEIPDYKERTFYISGTHSMVSAVEQTLKSIGIPKQQVKKDFFPGLS